MDTLAKSQNNDELSLLNKINNNQNIKFVFSLWNLQQIIKGEKNAIQISKAKFIDSLDPLWILDMLNIKELEIQYFLYKNYYKFQCEKPNPIKKYLSEMSGVF